MSKPQLHGKLNIATRALREPTSRATRRGARGAPWMIRQELYVGLDEMIRIFAERGMWAGRITEIFLSPNRIGSPTEAAGRDAAVTVSIALQVGAEPETRGP